jgi:collagen type I alpha
MKIKRTVFAVVLGMALGTAGVAGAATASSVHWPATCAKFSCVDKHLNGLHRGVKRALHRTMTPGPTGAVGATGAQGPAGVAGPAGATGATGADGAQGIQGIQGIQGATGADGAQGIQGATGADGAQGIQGATGADGAQGIQGIQGDPGVAGPAGPTGPMGPAGPTGPQGDPGVDGNNGTNGTDGTNGIDGTNGTNGIDGTNGTNGIDGTNGTDGQSVTVTAEAAGANCANAGQKLVSVSGTSYVCNGASGLTTVTIVAGTAGAFPGNAAVGATVTSTATCASGKLVGGGANITGNDAAHTIAAVTSSYPSAAATWTATATAFVHTANGSPPSVTAYALCAS